MLFDAKSERDRLDRLALVVSTPCQALLRFSSRFACFIPEDVAADLLDPVVGTAPPREVARQEEALKRLSVKTTLAAAMISIAFIPISLLRLVSARSVREFVVFGAFRGKRTRNRVSRARGMFSPYFVV